MSEACEDRDGRAGGATMLQPVILRFTLNAAAFAAARPTWGVTGTHGTVLKRVSKLVVYYCRTYIKAGRGEGG